MTGDHAPSPTPEVPDTAASADLPAETAADTTADAAAGDASADVRLALLQAGKTEFANYGYDGARLERIVARVGCAKRMLYYYFGNKKDVYLAVIGQCYDDIRASEERLNLDAMPPREALHRLAEQSFLYHEGNVEFTRLVLQENFQGGEMLRQIAKTDELRHAALAPLDRILRRGEAAGLFRPGIEAVDVHYLISALSGFRVDHAFTWQGLLQVDLLGEPTRSRHLQLLLNQLDALVGWRAPD